MTRLLTLFLIILMADTMAVQAEDARKNKIIFQPGSNVPEATGDSDDESKESARPDAVQSTPPAEGAKAEAEIPENLVIAGNKNLNNIPESIEKSLRLFFGLLGKKSIDAAYIALVKGSVIEKEPADVETLRTKTEQAINLFGSISGYEVITVQRVGSHLLSVTCISLGELYPLRWKFYYYKANESWGLIDIRVDDRLSDLFNEKEEPAPTNP